MFDLLSRAPRNVGPTHRNGASSSTPDRASAPASLCAEAARGEKKAAEVIGLYLRPGVFRSIPDLRSKLLRYIRHYNKTATPIKWTYSNSKQRIKP